jgi:hypothetical protein
MEALGPQLRDLPDLRLLKWTQSEEAGQGFAEIGHEFRSLEG